LGGSWDDATDEADEAENGSDDDGEVATREVKPPEEGVEAEVDDEDVKVGSESRLPSGSYGRLVDDRKRGGSGELRDSWAPPKVEGREKGG
jgi:hypothetical protein